LKHLVLALLFLSSSAYAGNAKLAERSSVPTGERIANYLQAVVSSASELVNAQNQGDLFGGHTPDRFSFNYDPDNQVVDVDVVGGLETYADARKMLELTQKLVFSLNRKIEKYYGVTLTTDDLTMVYFNAKTGSSVAKYEKGQYIDKLKEQPYLTPTPMNLDSRNP
jgi:hypothetical protein